MDKHGLIDSDWKTERLDLIMGVISIALAVFIVLNKLL